MLIVFVVYSPVKLTKTKCKLISQHDMNTIIWRCSEVKFPKEKYKQGHQKTVTEERKGASTYVNLFISAKKN